MFIFWFYWEDRELLLGGVDDDDLVDGVVRFFAQKVAQRQRFADGRGPQQDAGQVAVEEERRQVVHAHRLHRRDEQLIHWHVARQRSVHLYRQSSSSAAANGNEFRIKMKSSKSELEPVYYQIVARISYKSNKSLQSKLEEVLNQIKSLKYV